MNEDESETRKDQDSFYAKLPKGLSRCQGGAETGATRQGRVRCASAA